MVSSLIQFRFTQIQLRVILHHHLLPLPSYIPRLLHLSNVTVKDNLYLSHTSTLRDTVYCPLGLISSLYDAYSFLSTLFPNTCYLGSLQSFRKRGKEYDRTMQSPSFLTVLYTHSLGVSVKSRENSDFRYPVSWPKLITGGSDTNWGLTFRGPCIVMYSYNESQRDALFLKFI